MVRRGSTVRVRQRALQKRRTLALSCSGRLAPSRTCGGYGAVYGAFKHGSRRAMLESGRLLDTRSGKPNEIRLDQECAQSDQIPVLAVCNGVVLMCDKRRDLRRAEWLPTDQVSELVEPQSPQTPDLKGFCG